MELLGPWCLGPTCHKKRKLGGELSQLQMVPTRGTYVHLVYRAAYGSPFKAAKHGNICHILGSASCNRLRLRSLQLRVDGYNGPAKVEPTRQPGDTDAICAMWSLRPCFLEKGIHAASGKYGYRSPESSEKRLHLAASRMEGKKWLRSP